MRYRPRFRLRAEAGPALAAHASSLETARPDGTHQQFDFVDRGGYLESTDEIPEPHAFLARVRVDADENSVVFEEHEHAHGNAHRDNNMRASVIHVLADAAVSVLVIVGLLLARALGWLWMEPLAGVIASRSYGLIRDTGKILLDMNPDPRMANSLQQTIKADVDRIADLHLWRLGPGHLGAIACVETHQVRRPECNRAKLARFRTLSHLTIEVQSA